MYTPAYAEGTKIEVLTAWLDLNCRSRPHIQYTTRKYQAPPKPFRRGRSIANPFRRNPQVAYESKLEKVWEESLDKEQVELFCKGIVDEVVAVVIQQAENRKEQVMAQLDTPVRELVLGQ